MKVEELFSSNVYKFMKLVPVFPVSRSLVQYLRGFSNTLRNCVIAAFRKSASAAQWTSASTALRGGASPGPGYSG